MFFNLLSIFLILTQKYLMKELFPAYSRFHQGDTLPCSLLRDPVGMSFFFNSSAAALGLIKGEDQVRQEVTGLEVSVYMW